MAVVENAGVELGKSVGSNSANRNPETSTTPQNDLSAGSSGGSVSDAKPNASSSGASTAKDPCFPSSSSVTGLEGCNLDWCL
ncbi:hypothetical protein ACFX1W_025631 [Malus domestica]